MRATGGAGTPHTSSSLAAQLRLASYEAQKAAATMMDEADTHRLGFRIRARIGRILASCIDAWDHVRPPKDDYERRLMSLMKPLQSEAPSGIASAQHHPIVGDHQ